MARGWPQHTPAQGTASGSTWLPSWRPPRPLTWTSWQVWPGGGLSVQLLSGPEPAEEALAEAEALAVPEALLAEAEALAEVPGMPPWNSEV